MDFLSNKDVLLRSAWSHSLPLPEVSGQAGSQILLGFLFPLSLGCTA